MNTLPSSGTGNIFKQYLSHFGLLSVSTDCDDTMWQVPELKYSHAVLPNEALSDQPLLRRPHPQLPRGPDRWVLGEEGADKDRTARGYFPLPRKRAVSPGFKNVMQRSFLGWLLSPPPLVVLGCVGVAPSHVR